MRRASALALGLAPGLGLPLLWGGGGALRELQALPPAVLAGALALAAGCWVLSAARLRLLLGRVGKRPDRRQALRMQLAVEFGQCSLPAGAGGAVVWGLLGERAGVRPAAALAAYACDRVVDLVFFAVAVPAVALWCWSHDTLPIPGGWVAAQAGLALAVLAGFALALRPGRTRRRGRARLPRRSRARLRWGARWVRQAGHLLRDVGPVAGAQLFGFATAHWLARYSILAMLLHGLDAAQPWPLLFLVQTFALALAQAVPLPGGAGSVEGGVGALLAGRMDAATLAAVLLAWRGVTYHVHLLAGAAGWMAVFRPARGRVDWTQPLTDARGEP